MILEAFLWCALSLPSPNFTRPHIVSYHAVKSEEERLKEWIRKNNPEAEIFIHPNPQENLLKEYGYEKLPFTYKEMQIWIRRKPVSDKRGVNGIGSSA